MYCISSDINNDEYCVYDLMYLCIYYMAIRFFHCHCHIYKRNCIHIYNRNTCSASKHDKLAFLHDRSWISPWIKSISNELDIIIHVIVSQLSRHCDVISNLLWRHQQKKNRASETRGRCVKIVVLSSFMDWLCHVRNKITYVLSSVIFVLISLVASQLGK